MLFTDGTGMSDDSLFPDLAKEAEQPTQQNNTPERPNSRCVTIRVPCGAARATEPRKEGPMTKLRYVILFVSDMDRSVAFYRDMLGWPLKSQSPERTEFAAEGTTLALHYASRPSGAAAVQGEIAGRCQLGLSVDDVEAFHQDRVVRGTLCIQPPTEDACGAKLAVYADPDGLPFSVAASLKKGPAGQGLLGSGP
jgi:lactoylglutathione lyase